MTASHPVLRAGMGLAWSTAALYAVYIAVLFAGGVAVGVPVEPYLAAAEVISIAGAVLQVALFAAIHASAPPDRRVFSLAALGWVLATAAATATIHVVQLTVGRRIDLAAMPELRFVFGWDWPSLLYGVELTAWHLLFGLALLCAAPVFRGGGRPAIVRAGFSLSGLLCLAGLAGPAIGDLGWRMIGVFGYAVVFPLTCLVLGLVFRDAARAKAVEPV